MSDQSPSVAPSLKGKIFVGYTQEDFLVAQEVVKRLEGEGIGCWLARRDIPPGEVWEKEVNAALSAAQALLVIVSVAATKSDWVKAEVTAAKKAGKYIFPYVLEKEALTGLNDLAVAIRSFQRNETLDEGNREQVLQEIAAQIKRTFGVSAAEVSLAEEELLWRIAYTFLRLDQLPNGGWGKSLVPWIRRLGFPEPREQGGMAVTMSALHVYLEFMHRSTTGSAPADTRGVNGRVIEFLRTRRGLDGGIDSMGGRVTIHHTLIGLACYLLEAVARPQALRHEEARMLASYLARNLTRWKDEEKEKQRALGIACTAALLLDLIKDDALRRELTPVGDSLQTLLENEIEGLARFIVQTPNQEDCPFYGSDASLCRSDFVMNLLLLIRHGDLVSSGARNPNLFGYIVDGCLVLLDEVHPFRDDAPHESLVCSKKGSNPQARSPDWGLSAALLAALQAPRIREAVMKSGIQVNIEVKVASLRQAVSAILCRCGMGPDTLYLSNGMNIANALHLVSRKLDRLRDITRLDQRINDTLASGVTERSLESLVKLLVTESGIQMPDAKVDWLKNLLMERLESGEHVPNPERNNAWKDVIRGALKDTKRFFEGAGGITNATKNREHLLPFFAERLRDFADFDKLRRKGRLQALDIGCGDGLFGEVLGGMGFRVHLLDFSQPLLARAEANLKGKKISCVHYNYDIKDLGHFVEAHSLMASFHVIFAGAVLFHIPRGEVPRFLENCFNLLIPGALLFVNIKIGDHSLIARDGRFFEYYRDHEVLARMLRVAGFEICEIDLRDKHHNMYDMKLTTRWANYYCKRPEETT